MRIKKGKFYVTESTLKKDYEIQWQRYLNWCNVKGYDNVYSREALEKFNGQRLFMNGNGEVIIEDDVEWSVNGYYVEIDGDIPREELEELS
jgi:hypothetical protein